MTRQIEMTVASAAVPILTTLRVVSLKLDPRDIDEY